MNLKKILSISLASAFLTMGTPSISQAGFFDGIANAVKDGLDTPKRNLAAYEKVEDKELVNQFFFISPDGSQQGFRKDIGAKLDYDLVKINESVLTFSNLYLKTSMYSINELMKEYSYDPIDFFGERYIKFAESRGNEVRLYKPKMNALINELVIQNFRFKPARNVATWIGVDNALAEFKPNGELVSLMTRGHQAVDQLGATSDRYTNIYYGKTLMRPIENSISKRAFDDNFMRVVTLAGSATPQKANAVPATVIPTQEKKIQMLQQLAELKKSGALTEEEFVKEKAKLLGN